MKYHPRRLEKVLLERLSQFPVVALTGPRQSGKTTLVKHLLPDWKYVSLEDFDQRMSAQEDPRGFLRLWKPGTIIDEFQRAPELVSYLQGIVDRENRTGQYVLTGSQSYVLHAQLSQSLAGRVGLLVLHPFSHSELSPDNSDEDVWDSIFKGGFPRVVLNRVPAEVWFPSFTATCLERDVRQMLAIKNLEQFQLFIRLLAARAGQLVNYASISRDCSISVPTTRQWLSVLQAGYLVHRLPPWFSNTRKKLVKTPKVYFSDTGLLCHLMDIHSAHELTSHPQRGVVFENWVVLEVLKSATHNGLEPDLHFWRDSDGNEVDLIATVKGRSATIEAKASETARQSHVKGLKYLRIHEEIPSTNLLVYGGKLPLSLGDVKVVPWDKVNENLSAAWNL
jgi:uncharacterized protein